MICDVLLSWMWWKTTREGFNIRIYDRNVKVSELTGTNKDFIMAKIPHLQHFVTDDLDVVCRNSDVLVVTNKEKDFADVLKIIQRRL